MRERRRNRLPTFPNPMMRVKDILDEDTLGTYCTQAISDTSSRLRETNVAVPSDLCVEDSKSWVDENHK